MATYLFYTAGEDVKIRARSQRAAEERFAKEHPGEAPRRIMERVGKGTRGESVWEPRDPVDPSP